MIIEGYDPGSEEPREIDPRRRLENILILSGVFLLLVVLTILGNRDYKLPVECYQEAAEIVTGSGTSISVKMDLVVSTRQENIFQGDGITLIIENTSEHSVWFPPGLNLEIFEKVSGPKYVGRRNLSTSGSDQEKILESGNQFIEMVIKPDVVVLDEPKEIMVSVWGYRYQDKMFCREKHIGTVFLTIYSDRHDQARLFTQAN